MIVEKRTLMQGPFFKELMVVDSLGFRIGLDLIFLSRVEELYNRHSTNFLQRFFTEDEIKYCFKSPIFQKQIECMGGFIAAKEAVMKVLGEGWPRIPWTDIEVIHDERNRPFVALKGEGLLHMEQSNFESVQISITHDELIAAAVAIGIPGKF